MFLDGRYTGSCKCVLSGQQQPSILHEMQAGWALAEARALTALARSRWVARPFTASAFRRRRSPLAASYPARSVVIYTKTGDNGRSSLFTGCIRTYIHTWAMRHMQVRGATQCRAMLVPARHARAAAHAYRNALPASVGACAAPPGRGTETMPGCRCFGEILHVLQIPQL